MIREIQHYTGESCPECIKKGLPCPVLYKSYQGNAFYCKECGHTWDLIAQVPEMLFELRTVTK
jgi:uncharacterized protein YbaR (Trm112 family)